MNTARLFLAGALALAALPFQPLRAAQPGAVRVLLVTGGHEFETNAFLTFFKSLPGVSVQWAQQPQAQALFKADAAKSYDTIVLYDFWQKISEESKADFLARLKEGKGLLALHHCIADYQDWPEYERVIGGRYYLKKTRVNGVDKAVSTWKHDVDFTISVADPAHPVVRGLKDFNIHDETYGGYDTLPSSRVLLTTDEPTSGKSVAWISAYQPARVATVVLGHDHLAWQNPNFRRLMIQSLLWTSGQGPR